MAKTLVRNLVSWVSLTGALCCGAAQVTSDEARTAVGNWLTYRPQLGCRLGTSVAGARTCTTTNGVSFHVVNLAGGGFVVMSADTEQEPVVAFSPSDDLVESGENPLWAMLCRDFAGQAKAARLSHASAAGVTGSAVTPSERKWARLLPAKSTSGVARLQHAVTGKETISDVRVAPLLATRWSQEQDSYYSNMGDPCYNYYTPEHYPCGCVATATAQLMRYHRFPTASVTPGTYACSVMTGKDWISSTSYYPIYSERKLTMKGGTYDWDSMPLVPADGTTLAQRQAIGKLTSDIGISCLMAYGEGGSSAAAYMAARCLPDRFGYANAVAACSDRNLPADLVRRAFQSSLNAKLPVIVGLSGATGGHAVVADGYGYSMSTLYVHFNFGWAGRDDAWYAPPNLAEYSSIDALVYNIYPTGAKGGVICSGRVTDADGEPMSGAVVSVRGDSAATAMTDSLGIYSFVLSPGTYTVASGNASKSVTLKANTGTKVNDSGSYVVSTPQVSNLCDVDLVVTGEAPVVTTYKVTFVLGAHGTRTGGGALTQTVEDGNAAVAPTFTVADGWEFTGWDKSFDRVTGNLTVTAQYEEVVPLTVYEDLDEARDAATRDGKLIFLLSGATWCGYTLQLQQYIADAGSAFADNYVYLWHDQDEDPFGIAETSSVPEFWIFQPSEFSLETKDAWDETALYVCRGCPMRYEYFLSAIEWYAESRPAKGITVTLDANGGDVSASSIVRTPGAAFGALPEPVRAGYAFVGWFTAPNGGTRVTATSIVSSSVTRLYAQWLAEPEMHTVTFVLGAHGTRTGGGALTQTVEDGNAAVAPTFTVADGWEFTGWDKSFDRVTGNLTVTAQYEEVVPLTVYEDLDEARDAATRDGKLIFLLSGATWCGYTLQLQQYIADAGSAFADNYVYLWHDQDEDPFGIAETSSVPEFWIFQPSEFSLETKDAWDETALYVCRGCPMKYEYFLSAIEWYAESRPAKGITVSLDANGGDVSASSIVRTPGAAFGALPEPVRAGYAFVGWFTAPNGGTRVTATSIVSSSVTRLYAQWLAEPEMHTVTFVLGAHGTRTGGGALTQTVEDGNAAVAPTFTVADGWEFAGWDMAFDRVTGNLTVTAQYEEGVPIEEPEDPEEPDVWRAGEAGEIAAPETTLTGKIGWSAKNLPKGLKIDAKTGVISGTPTAPGSYVVKVTAKSGAASETFDVEVTIGHYVDEMLPLEGVYEALVGVKTLVELGGNFAGCKATGLPSGLKFAAKDVNDKDFGAVPAGTVYGVPSKACTNVVVFTYKEGKVTRTASATFAVAGIPAWSVGTFNGRLDDGTGSATLTVAAGGKVSGKVVAGGMTWAFSSSGYETAVRDEDAGGEVTELSIEATAKSGTQTVDVALTVRCNGVTGDLAVGDIGATMTLWRNAWKDRGATDRLKEYVGLYTVQLDGDDSGTGYLSLTVDAKGTCKAAGKIPDGTSASGTLPLVWLEPESGAEEEGRLMAVWQMAPSAYKGGCVGGLLTWGGMRPVSSATDTEVGPPAVTGEDIAWVSKAPTASGEYGEGFERTLSANGAYYNKLAALYDYYTTLAFGAESPMLDATVKTTDYDDDDKKTTVSETIEVGAVEPACWGALTVSLDTKRAAFVVDQGKATKPVQDTETKEWSYEGENDAALTLSFTKATGVFKGSFTCWYDYVSATDNTKEPAKETLTHTSKKVSYEGVMVLGEPLRGFYLWDRTGTYEDEKTGKEKTFKYKESRPVFFE